MTMQNLATGHVLPIPAAVAVPGVVAAVPLRPGTLRTDLDLPAAARTAAVAADALDGSPAVDQVDPLTSARHAVPGRH